MNVLVTAGNTLTLIDKVRAITNVFTGRTGAAIALAAYQRGHRLTLLTSHPEAVADLPGAPQDSAEERWSCVCYRTFEDLQTLMARHISAGNLDAVIHSAAVSDYHCAGVYAPAEQTRFDPAESVWHSRAEARLVDRSAGKVKSDEPELWLRLVRAPKLVDMIRGAWGFQKTLVKFKLEVGVSDEHLLQVAERSRLDSQADLMVANTLEGAAHYAFIGPPYERVSRGALATTLLDLLESRHGKDQ